MNEQIIKKKIVILDGARSEDKQLGPLLILLTDLLEKEFAALVTVFRLRDIQINQCIGCFDCWLKTPGKCIHTQDRGAALIQEVLTSDILIFFSPVVFGGYSSELKKVLDRFLPIALPFLEKINGEAHHPRRYAAFPHIIGIGICPNPSDEITHCFRTLVGRTSLNAGTSCSAAVFSYSEPSTLLQQRLLELFPK